MIRKSAIGGIEIVAAVCVAACGVASAQSALPAIGPTAAAPPAASAVDAAPAPAPTHRAQVSYQMGQLTVITENSSLDQILREIASQTGMKITGGVTDQQVFGTYGPAAPSEVLGALLEGSGSNMILRETAANEPTELVLTPMQGIPSPSDLNARPNAPQLPAQPYAGLPQNYGASPQTISGPQGGAPAQGPRPAYFSPPQTGPAISQPGAGFQPEQQAAPADGNPRSPNGVATPQQIYEQLQKLQQQQQQPKPDAPQ